LNHRFVRGSLLLIALVGCSSASSSSASAVDASDSSQQAASVTTASYSVPVEPALADAATFPVSGVQWKVNGPTASLDYDLPLGLTGIRQRVNLQGTFDATKNAYVLAGALGTGECTVAGSALRCTEYLPGVTTDTEAAARLTPPTVDAAKRRTVIQRYPSDPIGILDATLRVRGRDDAPSDTGRHDDSHP
jgi:hypothetical protein